MTSIRLSGIRKAFGGGPPVLAGVDLSVRAGERVAIVGPSGAGKTTALRLVAGFERPDSGAVFFNDRDDTALPPEKRDVAFVFQGHALYPHLTVAENLAFPLRLRGHAAAEIDQRVRETARQLELEPLLARRPTGLSGGESQRVALGRALIRRPAVLLMDEPLSSLPPDLRLRLRALLLKLHAQDRRTLLYVTHDHEEALALGERVAVLHGGQVQQFAPPREIFERPANQFVASFVGRPSMNFIDGEIQSGCFVSEGMSLPVIGADGKVTLGIRPEDLEICDPSVAWLTAPVDQVHYCGPFSDVLAGRLVLRHFGPAEEIRPTVPVRARPDRAHFFDRPGGTRREASLR